MKYYVNNEAQPNGDHEVHQENCKYLPLTRIFLGFFPSCEEALKEAKKLFPKSNGCFTCSRNCFTPYAMPRP